LSRLSECIHNMSTSSADPDAQDYLLLFARYHDESGVIDFGRAYLEPEDERYRLLFQQVCRLLVKSSPFNLAMPQEFRRTARLYLAGDPKTVAHMGAAQMRHFMLSDFYDYVHLCRRMGQERW
jgi:hypothetical protein